MFTRKKIFFTVLSAIFLVSIFVVPAFAQSVTMDIDPEEKCFEGDTVTFTANAEDFENPEYKFLYRKAGGGTIYTGQEGKESFWEVTAPPGLAGLWDVAVQVREKGESGWPGIGQPGFDMYEGYEILALGEPSVTLTIDPADTIAEGQEATFTAESENVIDPEYRFIYRSHGGSKLYFPQQGSSNVWTETAPAGSAGTWDFGVQVKEAGTNDWLAYDKVEAYVITEEDPVDPIEITVSDAAELEAALNDQNVATIILEDGEYVGQFLVQYPQTIKAENPNEAIIKLPENNLEKAEIAERMRTWVIRVHDVEDVTIQGLTICGGDGAPEEIDEEEVHLLGIVYDDASGTIEGNIVQNIRRSEPGAAGNYFSYSKGILVDGATGDTNILDNTVYLHEHGRLAITVGKSQQGAAVTIEGNKVSGVGDDMVHNWLHSGITVIDVACAVNITDNDLTDIQSAKENSVGIFVISVDGISGEITIQDNRITETQFGIRIWETGNPITGDLVISDNAIYDNIYYGVYNDSDTVIDARNNWWGDAGGPSGDVNDPETEETADGDGDRINENVRFDPWYIDEDMETLSNE